MEWVKIGVNVIEKEIFKTSYFLTGEGKRC